MRAMILEQLGTLAEHPQPLRLVEREAPVPGPGEVRIRVATCGVCHTELDEIEGRLPPPHLPVVPGHQAVGRVEACGAGVTRWREGDRVGVGWIHHSSGARDENLSPDFVATGRDVDGGYAEVMTVPQDYAYAIPAKYSDTQAAPLLCAGGIGYRALSLCELSDGDVLGLTGFGGSGHLVLRLARFLFPGSPVYVFARDPAVQQFARDCGADWAGHTDDRAPAACRAIIDTTPAWRPVVAALGSLAPGGRLVINAIRKEDYDRDSLAALSYHEHLWLEREIKSVANITQFDIRALLEVAADADLAPVVETYQLEDANRALRELRQGQVRGAKVLQL